MALHARMRDLRALLAVLALSGLAPSQAHAWTHAQVVGAKARIDASGAKVTRVELHVDVLVTGGWLSSFELTGLEPDFALTTDAPPTLLAADGTEFTPTAGSPEPGVLVLSFADRASSPRRGRHTVRVTYETGAPHALATHPNASSVRLRLSLPRWEVSLADVEVSVVAPAGAKLVSASDAPTLFDTVSSRMLAGGLEEFTLTRASLPRGQAFEVVLDVSTASPTGQAPRSREHAVPTAWWLAGAVAVLALLKRRLARRAAERLNLSLLPLVPLRSEFLRSLLVLSGLASGAALSNTSPLLAALLSIGGVLCALDARAVRRALPSGCTERDAVYEDLAGSAHSRARDLSSVARWFDVTTPAGAATLSALCAPTFWQAARGADAMPWLLSACLVMPLFLTATRLTRPIRTERVLQHLAALRTELRALPARSNLVISVAPWGENVQARLRVVPVSVPAGMGKLDLGAADANLYGQPRWALCWYSQCRAGSPADLVLSRALPHAVREVGADGCVRRRSITLDVLQDAERLLAWLEHETLQQAA